MTREATAQVLKTAELIQGRSYAFALKPDNDACTRIAAELGIDGLRKLRFEGELRPLGRRDWELRGHLGATVIQPCVVTLAPVTTRIEEDVARIWRADMIPPEGEEVEMPDAVEEEPLGSSIDLGAVMVEALALALPVYPRAEGAELEEARFAEPGVTPMSDEEARPFAGLAALRDRLSGGGDESADD